MVDAVNERGAACARARVESTTRRSSFIIHHQHKFSPHSPRFRNAFRMGLAVGIRCPPRGRAQVTPVGDFSRAIGQNSLEAASAGAAECPKVPNICSTAHLQCGGGWARTEGTVPAEWAALEVPIMGGCWA